MDTQVFAVEQLGIKDIDGYGHVWYGNYLKFFERGAQRFLGGGNVARVLHLKYKQSVPWGAADSRIESYLVDRPSPGRALIFQRWCVGHGTDNTYALCLSELVTEPGIADSLPIMDPKARLMQGNAGAREPMLTMAVKNLQNGSVPPIDANAGIIGRMVIGRHVFRDMVLPGSLMLQRVDVMDLFEQTRTEVVGGQPGLKAFLDRGLALVVAQIDELRLAQGVEVTPSSTLGCEVTLIRETTERRCFHFLQRLVRTDGVEVASVYVLMCCTDPVKGELVRVPDDCWASWEARLQRLASSSMS